MLQADIPFGFPWVANQPSLSSLSRRTSPPAASYSSSTDAALRRQGTEQQMTGLSLLYLFIQRI